jgi:hypothetical protein
MHATGLACKSVIHIQSALCMPPQTGPLAYVPACLSGDAYLWPQASPEDEGALRSALSSAGGLPDSLVAAYKAVLTDPVSVTHLTPGGISHLPPASLQCSSSSSSSSSTLSLHCALPVR